MSQHLTISPAKPRTVSRSENSLRPTRIAPIVAMRKVRCLSLLPILTSWCT